MGQTRFGCRDCHVLTYKFFNCIYFLPLGGNRNKSRTPNWLIQYHLRVNMRDTQLFQLCLYSYMHEKCNSIIFFFHFQSSPEKQMFSSASIFYRCSSHLWMCYFRGVFVNILPFIDSTDATDLFSQYIVNNSRQGVPKLKLIYKNRKLFTSGILFSKNNFFFFFFAKMLQLIVT